MVLFYLTNSVLDISFGVLWWVTKNTSYGIINSIIYMKNNYYDTENNINSTNLVLNDNNYEVIENINTIENLKNEINELKKIIDKKK
jgi:hypothetical protein